MKFVLPQLNFAYDALEPFIDAKTMEIHYSKHHQAYTDKFNAALERFPELSEKNPEDLLKELNNLAVDEATRAAIRNHGGGYVNHSFFWNILGKEKQIDENLVKEIEENFENLANFKEKFNQTALGHFGSGWAWLARDEEGKLQIYSTPNQDSPLTKGHTPIITLDVWEHAYYLKYQNKRVEYIENWWNVLKILP